MVCHNYLSNQIECGNVLGPFSGAVAPKVPFGVIPKKHQPEKYRFITDLSFPEGLSVNDTIDLKLCTLVLHLWIKWPKQQWL